MKCRDLQVKQLKDFSFDGGGWFWDHIEFSGAYLLNFEIPAVGHVLVANETGGLGWSRD
jgi:hypothetical protein